MTRSIGITAVTALAALGCGQGTESPTESVPNTPSASATTTAVNYDAVLESIRRTPRGKIATDAQGNIRLYTKGKYKGRPVVTELYKDRVAAAAPLYSGVIAETKCEYEMKPEWLAATWYGESRLMMGSTHDTAESHGDETVPDSATGAQGAHQIQPDTAGDHMFPGYEPQSFLSSARMAARIYCGYIKMFKGNLEQAIRAYAGGQKHIKQPKAEGSAETAAKTLAYWENYHNRVEEFGAFIASRAPAPAPVVIAQTTIPAGGLIKVGHFPLHTSSWYSGYGDDRKDDNDRFYSHEGVDLVCKIGDPVESFGEGTVSKVFNDRRAGLTVVIDHGMGPPRVNASGFTVIEHYATRYLHLSERKVVEGQRIAEGEEIAKCGDSGNAKLSAKDLVEGKKKPHLHFEIKVDGHHENPCGGPIGSWRINCDDVIMGRLIASN